MDVYVAVFHGKVRLYTYELALGQYLEMVLERQRLD